MNSYTVEDIIRILEKESPIVGGSHFTATEENDMWQILPRDVDYAAGASKFVIIPPCENWVMKIPFDGEYDDGYDEYDEPLFDDDSFSYFCGASKCVDGTLGEWDYCWAETEIYKKAADAGLCSVFARTERAGDVCGYPVYIQEKCETFYSRYSYNDSDEEKEIIKSTSEKIKSWSENRGGIFCDVGDAAIWMSDVISIWGDAFAEKLVKFLADNEIGDLHEENFGYCGNYPVIIDYSDFRN